jgi:hypothetical protein
MLMANNERMLSFKEELDGEDLEAVAGRFFHIRVTKDAEEFLVKIGGREKGTHDWVDGDLIAKHALWLRDNPRADFKPGRRFVVEGRQTSLHRSLLFQGPITGMVMEWLVGFLSEPEVIVKPITTKGRFTDIFCKGTKLYVSTNALSKYWDQYIKSVLHPSVNKLGRALHSLSEGRKRDTKTGCVYWIISKEMILNWVDVYGSGNREKIVGYLDGVEEFPQPLSMNN